MRYIYVLLLACFSLFTSSLLAQQYLVDTIQQELLKENTPIQEIDLRLGLVRAYSFIGDTEASTKHLAIIRELSKKHQYIPGIVAGLLFRGGNEQQSGNPKELMLKNITEALKIARAHQDKASEAFAAYHLAGYYIYKKDKFEKGAQILHEALQNIDASVPDKHIGNIYKLFCVLYQYQGEDSLAIVNYEKAMYHFNRVATHPFLVPELGRADAMSWDKGLMNKGQMLIHLAEINQDKGAYTTALKLSEEARQIFSQSKSPKNLGWALETQALIYFDIGNYESCIRLLQEAAIIYEEKKLPVSSMWVYDQLGAAFLAMEDLDNSLNYYKKGKVTAKKTRDTILIINFTDYIGRILLKKGKIEAAEQYTDEALQLAQLINSPLLLPEVYNSMGQLHEAKGNSPQALAYFKQSYASTIKLNRPHLLAEHSMNYAKCLSDNNQLDSAQFYLKSVLQIMVQHPNPRLSESLERIASEIYEKSGDYQLALSHHQNYVDLMKASRTQDAQKILKNEQVRQDVVGIEAQRKQAELEADLLASRNQLYIALAGGLGLILLLGTYLFNQLRKTKLQLENQNIQLQQLNATKDKFFGIIAHDIRSPIVALDGVGEQMDYYLQKNKPEKLQRLAGRIDGTAKRLGSLLDNLLNWALLQQGVIPYHPKVLNVKVVAEHVLDMFKENAALKNIDLTVDIASDLNVHADESAMNTILRNLVSNAIKFTPQGGKVALSTATKGDKVFININDTGTGIAAEKLPKLFSLEKQSEDGTAGERGTGLGLTLVKELAELNKGTIRVLSEVGKGSEFIVGLPVAA